jgi:hypothetical protein
MKAKLKATQGALSKLIDACFKQHGTVPLPELTPEEHAVFWNFCVDLGKKNQASDDTDISTIEGGIQPATDYVYDVSEANARLRFGMDPYGDDPDGY